MRALAQEPGSKPVSAFKLHMAWKCSSLVQNNWGALEVV